MIAFFKVMINHDRKVRKRNRNDAVHHSADNNDHINLCILFIVQLSRGNLTSLGIIKLTR